MSEADEVKVTRWGKKKIAEQPLDIGEALGRNFIAQ